MKKLSLFLTLSLLSIIGTSTIVKAESAEGSLNQSNVPNSVIISDQDDVVDPTGGEVQPEEIEVMTDGTDTVKSSEFEESAQTLDSEDEMPETTENSAPVK